MCVSVQGLDFLWSSQAWKEGGDVAVANWITMMNPMDSGEIGKCENGTDDDRDRYTGGRC